MEAGKKYPFSKIIQLNIGNPQSLGQHGFSFNREVLAACLTRSKDEKKFHPDAIARA